MLRKDLKTNPVVAVNAVRQRETQTALPERCLTLFVLNAVLPHRYLSSPKKTVPFTVTLASRHTVHNSFELVKKHRICGVFLCLFRLFQHIYYIFYSRTVACYRSFLRYHIFPFRQKFSLALRYERTFRRKNIFCLVKNIFLFYNCTRFYAHIIPFAVYPS